MVAHIAQGQSLGLSNPVSVVSGSLTTMSGADELEADWGVLNLSNTTVTVKARRNIITEVAGSSNYFCWGVCFDSTVNISPITVNIAAGDTNFSFYAHYRPWDHAGTTAINYSFYLNGNTGDEVNQTVIFCVDSDCAIGVEEEVVKASLSHASGNAFTQVIYRLPVGVEKGTWQLYASSGQLVKQVQVQKNQGVIILDNSVLESGVYISSLSYNDGQASMTEKFLIP